MTCQSSFSASERCAPQSGYEPFHGRNLYNYVSAFRFFHISLEALDIRQSQAFLYGRDALAFAHILVQIPPME